MSSERKLSELFSKRPYCLILGDSNEVLKGLPKNSVNTAMTSPPYWMLRKYDGNGTIGHEPTIEGYVQSLVSLFHVLKRVLRRDGSFWLNIDDTYENKNLCGIPWKVALAMQNDGWILRQAVVWDKIKGNPSNSKDKLRNMYEFVFHFVQDSRYYCNLDAVRTAPLKPYWRKGHIVTATGVSGTKYRQQIMSSDLTATEKQNAISALEQALHKVETGQMPDFRMIIRGTQRTTHSDSPEFSGRARELEKEGFYILPYHKNGSPPGDIWRITPEDEVRVREDRHFAVYPKELCEIPIRSTCPIGGIVLDPLVGTGTTILSALEQGRRGIGIDISKEYLAVAKRRIEAFLEKGNPIPLYGAM